MSQKSLKQSCAGIIMVGSELQCWRYISSMSTALGHRTPVLVQETHPISSSCVSFSMGVSIDTKPTRQ
jgi:hypothetical protein